MYVLFDKNLKVRLVSDVEVECKDLLCRVADKEYNWSNLIGKRIPPSMTLISDYPNKETKNLKIAMVCNWGDKCGIATYSAFLTTAMLEKVSAIKIFSEATEESTDLPIAVEVDRCWKRGENLLNLADKIIAWEPDLILVQHEYGIFPNAFHFMQFMHALSGIPTAVCMHSVYRHLDKLVYAEAVPNIIVHTNEAKQVLKEMGNTSNVHVIPHGCLSSGNESEVWNIMRSPYTIMQFGFGFRYKGVEQILKAVSHLVHTDPKFENLYYFYLCSTNAHNETACQSYVDDLNQLAKELDIRKNFAVVLKYQTEQMLNLYLRLSKMVVFPYVTNKDNEVFAASGAARIAMASGRPVICSNAHLFDDMEGVLPRPKDYLELAKEIDEIFSNDAYKNSILQKSQDYINANTWSVSADKYLSLYESLILGK